METIERRRETKVKVRAGDEEKGEKGRRRRDEGRQRRGKGRQRRDEGRQRRDEGITQNVGKERESETKGSSGL